MEQWVKAMLCKEDATVATVAKG